MCISEMQTREAIGQMDSQVVCGKNAMLLKAQAIRPVLLEVQPLPTALLRLPIAPLAMRTFLHLVPARAAAKSLAYPLPRAESETRHSGGLGARSSLAHRSNPLPPCQIRQLESADP